MTYTNPQHREITGPDHLRKKGPDKKHPAGSLRGRIPVTLSDGKTIIYVMDGHDPDKVKQRYEDLLNRYDMDVHRGGLFRSKT